MVGLPDIATQYRKVEIRPGVEVEVTGINALDIANLANRFPEVKKFFDQQSRAEFTADSLAKLIPTMGSAVIAAGVGKSGDKKEEEKASKLPFGEQMALVTAIWTATFPKGLDSFMEGLAAFGLGGELRQRLAAAGMESATITPSPSTELFAPETSPPN